MNEHELTVNNIYKLTLMNVLNANMLIWFRMHYVNKLNQIESVIEQN